MYQPPSSINKRPNQGEVEKSGGIFRLGDDWREKDGGGTVSWVQRQISMRRSALV